MTPDPKYFFTKSTADEATVKIELLKPFNRLTSGCTVSLNPSTYQKNGQNRSYRKHLKATADQSIIWFVAGDRCVPWRKLAI